MMQAIKRFYEKNLFERIVVYSLLSFLLSKIYAEFVLGELLFYHPQVTQWIFFSALTLDYVVCLPKITRMRVTFNMMSMYSLIIMTMILHGLAVGIYNDNPLFTIFNDVVPLLMISLNILRMQSEAENHVPINFKFIFYTSLLVQAISTLSSIVVAYGGLLEMTLFTPDTMTIVTFCAALYTWKKIPLWCWIVFMIELGFGVTQLNRTTMLFLGIVFLGYVMLQILRAPIKGVIVLGSVIVVVTLAFNSLPKDSMTYVRINDLANLDLGKRTGAVGERQQEWDSINTDLRKRGQTDEWLGFGMGGTYTMKFTYEIREGYGHAHYSWAWFKMRFGELGYLYLAILAGMMMVNTFRGIIIGTPVSTTVAFICLFGLVYLVTYVNSVWLLSGLHFLHMPINRKILNRSQRSADRDYGELQQNSVVMGSKVN